jgi:uncharacterized protein YqgV (UPF0045/DUF77 family)
MKDRLLNLDVENRRKLIAEIDAIKQLCLEKAAIDEISTALEVLENKIGGEEDVDQRFLSAQLSLYPLRQPSLSPAINEALEILEDSGLRKQSGAMSTLIFGGEAKMWRALRKIFSAAAQRGDVVMNVSISNACPLPKWEENS